MKEVYKIKSITNYRGESIGERIDWIGLKVYAEQLIVNERALLAEVTLKKGKYKYKEPMRNINTSGVKYVQEIPGGFLFATHSGTCYELQKI